MLEIQNITFRIEGRTLFDRASAHVPDGHRIGLVGDNGSGKTTLIRLILGQEELDEGSIAVRARASVGVVAQEAPGGEQTPLEAVLAADAVRASLLREAETAREPARIAEIHTALADRGAHAAPARAAAILAGLGFDTPSQSRPLSSFSGGYRMRVALAAALFAEPDLLLLDEPTNHLDLEASLWLESFLETYPRTLLMVSHDRHMLSHAVTHILHLADGRLEIFSGGYEAFERTRAERASQNEATARRQEQERRRIEAFVARFRAKSSKARQAQSRIKLLERMEPGPAIVRTRRVGFFFPEPPQASSPLVRLDRVSVGYVPGQPVLSDLRLSLFAEDRIALVGANGNGKTTLARLLAGALQPEDGAIVRSSKVKVGYFAQDSLEQLDLERTAFEQLGRVAEGEPSSVLRAWLGRFGFDALQMDLRSGSLSGGEKTRLALALIAWKRPNLLILDEPTNHLDMGARDRLIDALNDFAGALLIISHDRHLMEATSDQLWLVGQGTVEAFFGDLDDYGALVLADARALRSRQRAERSEPERGDRKALRRDRAAVRSRVAPLKSEIRSAESELDALQAEKAELDALLSDPSTYARQGDEVKALARRQRDIQDRLARAEARWMEAQAALEEALIEEE